MHSRSWLGSIVQDRGWKARNKGWCSLQSSKVSCLHLSWNRNHKSHRSRPFFRDPLSWTRLSWSLGPCPSFWAPHLSRSRRCCSGYPGTSRIRHNSACYQIRIFHNLQAFFELHRWWDEQTCLRHSWEWTHGNSSWDSHRCTNSPADYHLLLSSEWSTWYQTFGSCREEASRYTFKWCNFSSHHWL